MPKEEPLDESSIEKAGELLSDISDDAVHAERELEKKPDAINKQYVRNQVQSILDAVSELQEILKR